MRNPNRASLAPDQAKALAILLVVFGHVLRGLERGGLVAFDGVWRTVDWAIYLFHMPLFFYLSGLFFAQTVAKAGYLGMLRRNLVVLVGPLVVWSYIQVGMQYVFSGSSNLKVGLDDVISAPFPPAQQFWFLGVLFVAMAVAGLLPALGASRRAAAAACVAALAARVGLDGWIKTAFESGPYWFLVGQFLWHFPFLLLGMACGNAAMDRAGAHPLAFLVAFAVVMAAALPVAPETPPLFAGVTVALVLLFYKVFMEAAAREAPTPGPVGRALAFVGANSMIIFLSHVIFGAGMRALLVRLGVFDVGPHLVFGTAAGMILPLFLVPVGLAMQRRAALFTRIALPVRAGRSVA
ncbi:conserved membrane hypothetical protein [uncultured Alphaproteobacteria bacterium]|uniref:Acyltransferase 3 domain-containing protein n=1 Tax=uncultured Alphaproteobacteria bacterium TaxID=91750 RepID=A0A212JHW6_9PROT|nr:conserved membrane hypothetical protein [uncultured Alphaproteobacteria bacterium]